MVEFEKMRKAEDLIRSKNFFKKEDDYDNQEVLDEAYKVLKLAWNEYLDFAIETEEQGELFLEQFSEFLARFSHLRGQQEQIKPEKKKRTMKLTAAEIAARKKRMKETARKYWESPEGQKRRAEAEAKKKAAA